jgi:hypothetical protein
MSRRSQSGVEDTLKCCCVKLGFRLLRYMLSIGCIADPLSQEPGDEVPGRGPVARATPNDRHPPESRSVRGERSYAAAPPVRRGGRRRDRPVRPKCRYRGRAAARRSPGCPSDRWTGTAAPLASFRMAWDGRRSGAPTARKARGRRRIHRTMAGVGTSWTSSPMTPMTGARHRSAVRCQRKPISTPFLISLMLATCSGFTPAQVSAKNASKSCLPDAPA